MKLTLLGTGSPIPLARRRGAAQVIESDNQLVLLDCGRGALDRLIDAGYVQPGGRGLTRPLPLIALTHLHSDHITGLPDLLWAGWIMRWWHRPPLVAGPPGTAAFVNGLMQAFAYDIAARTQAETSQRAELVPTVIEVEEGWRHEGSSWRVSAFRVDHEPVDQAFGYRLDDGRASVVVSGDTRVSENLIRNARRADLLVHEVYSRRGMAARLEATRSDPRAHALAQTVASYHTASDQVGRVAVEAEVDQLVLSHILVWGSNEAEIAEDVATDYRRPFTVGEDLQVFEI